MLSARVEVETIDNELAQQRAGGVRQLTGPLLEHRAADELAVMENVVPAFDAERFDGDAGVAIAALRNAAFGDFDPCGRRLGAVGLVLSRGAFGSVFQVRVWVSQPGINAAAQAGPHG